MTIVAAEAAPEFTAAAETGVASRGARAARQAPSRRPRPALGASPSVGRGGRAPSRRETAGDLAAASATGGYERAKGQRNHGKRSHPFTAGGSHHTIIAAEFFLAAAVVVVAPLVSSTPNAQQGGTGPSPYGRQELTRLAGIMTLFFVLALMSHGRPGKVAVAFGAVIDLAVIFRASQKGAIKGVGQVFSKSASVTTAPGGGGGGIQTAASTGTTAPTVNPGGPVA